MVNSQAVSACENLEELSKAVGVVEAALAAAEYVGSADVPGGSGADFAASGGVHARASEAAAAGDAAALQRELSAARAQAAAASEQRDAAEAARAEAESRLAAALAELESNATVFRLHTAELKDLHAQLDEKCSECDRLTAAMRGAGAAAPLA